MIPESRKQRVGFKWIILVWLSLNVYQNYYWLQKSTISADRWSDVKIKYRIECWDGKSISLSTALLVITLKAFWFCLKRLYLSPCFWMLFALSFWQAIMPLISTFKIFVHINWYIQITHTSYHLAPNSLKYGNRVRVYIYTSLDRKACQQPLNPVLETQASRYLHNKTLICNFC